MFAPLYDLVENDAGVQSKLGTPPRVYSFGEGPAKTESRYAEPYAVWQTIAGNPENNLAGRPTEDDHVLQIDVYAPTPPVAKAAVRALVTAIELTGYVTAWNGEFRDTDTGLFRISFTAEFITSR